MKYCAYAKRARYVLLIVLAWTVKKFLDFLWEKAKPELKFEGRLNFAEILAVVTHELVHKKGKHILLRLVTMIPFLALAMYSWSRLYSPIFFTESFTQIVLTVMVNIGLLAFMLVTMIVPNWILEFKADRTAAKFAGKENIKSALLKLVDKENYEEPSETHPSVAERIKRIDKLQICT